MPVHQTSPSNRPHAIESATPTEGQRTATERPATAGTATALHPGVDHAAAIVTRITRGLHRQLKLHCLENDMTLASFVTGALEDHLRSTRRKAGHGRSFRGF